MKNSDTANKKRSKTRFMLSKLFSSKLFAIIFLVAATMLSLMYYKTVSSSTLTPPILISPPILVMPYSLIAAILLGAIISLGIVSNIYVMKVIISSGQEAKKAASQTLLSMAAGAFGCVSSIMSVLLSLGTGIGNDSGFLAFLTANMLIFFGIALIMSLISIVLAGRTLSNVAHLVTF